MKKTQLIFLQFKHNALVLSTKAQGVTREEIILGMLISGVHGHDVRRGRYSGKSKDIHWSISPRPRDGGS